MNSRAKGKRAELEFARFVRARGFVARRGRQFHGGADSPDVVCATLAFHVEVKRVERLNLRDAVAQAEGDSRGKPWLVAHRWNLGPWLVTLRAEDFLDLVREALPSTLNSQPSTNLAPPPAPCGADPAVEPQPQTRNEPNRKNTP